MTTINHEYYVSPEVANLLKEAGFDWSCRGYYDRKILRFSFVWDHNGKGAPTQCSAPTLDVAQKWLREVKGWEAQVAYGFDEDGHKTYVTECGNPKGDLENYIVYFSTYEEAQEACINKALELILEEGE